MNLNRNTALIAIGIALAFAGSALAQGGGRGRGAIAATGGPAPLLGGRFKGYPQDAIARGLTALQHQLRLLPRRTRAKAANAGPDLVTSDVSLHDEDGIGLGRVSERRGASESRQTRSRAAHRLRHRRLYPFPHHRRGRCTRGEARFIPMRF